MSTPAPNDEDLAGLKSRRKAKNPRRPSVLNTPGEEELPPLPDAHDTMAAALSRPAGLPALHPLERRRLAVVETGGHVPAANLEADYVVSPFDAQEQIVPWGCTTPIARTLWARGQHVRRDVFATYLAQHPELDPNTVELPAVADSDADIEPDTDPVTGSGDPADTTPTEAPDGVAASTPPAAV